MNSRTKVEDALNNLATRIKLESLKLNEQNETYLLFDQKFHVTCVFNESNDEFVLTSMVGELKKNSVDAYKKLLSDNFFWSGTAGSRLFIEPGADEGSDSIVIKETIPLAMFDEERLYERVEDFVNAIEYWTTEYPKLKQGSGTRSSQASEAVGFGMMSA